MKQMYVAVMGSVLLAAAPLCAANAGSFAGTSSLAVQSRDGSGGSLGSSQRGVLGTSGASSSSHSEGAFASPDLGALDGYLDVGSGDFAKTRAAFSRAESRGAKTLERVVRRAAASEQATTASDGSRASTAGAVESTVSRVENAATNGPSNFDFATPASAHGIDVAAGLHALSLRGSAR